MCEVTSLSLETPQYTSNYNTKGTIMSRLIASAEDRKKMNQFFRWFFIVGSWLVTAIIVALIQDIYGKTPGRTPVEASVIAMFFYGVPALTPLFIWYMTRTKK